MADKILFEDFKKVIQHIDDVIQENKIVESLDKIMRLGGAKPGDKTMVSGSIKLL